MVGFSLLERVSFGAPAAERDISQGLEDYFVESPAFTRVLSGKKRVLLGNRGTGKSAILKMLAKRARGQNVLVLELTPEDYSYEMLAQIMTAEERGSWAKTGAYTAAWKYMIYLMCFKALYDRGSRLKTKSGRKLYEYIRDNHANVDKNPIASMISYLKRLEGVKVGAKEVTLKKSKELDKLYRLEEIQHLLPAFDEVLRQNSIYVIVDELDRGWDASEDARCFVAGLFQAATKMNEIHDERHFRVYLSLRQELYDNIPELYQDAQKHRDLVEQISWDEASLNDLVCRRIKHSLVEFKKRDNADAWSAVFATTLEYRKTNSFNYIVDRTLYRPREIIEFCTRAVEAAQSTGTPIGYQVISEAERAYSAERAKDIASEYRYQYPGLLGVMERFRAKRYTLDRDELEELLMQAICDVAPKTEAATWLADLEVERLIQILWQIGFLRAQIVGGIKGRQRSGSKYIGAYQIDTIDLSNVPRFDVHQMFRSHLGMREPKGAPAA